MHPEPAVEPEFPEICGTNWSSLFLHDLPTNIRRYADDPSQGSGVIPRGENKCGSRLFERATPIYWIPRLLPWPLPINIISLSSGRIIPYFHERTNSDDAATGAIFDCSFGIIVGGVLLVHFPGD